MEQARKTRIIFMFWAPIIMLLLSVCAPGVSGAKEASYINDIYIDTNVTSENKLYAQAQQRHIEYTKAKTTEKKSTLTSEEEAELRKEMQTKLFSVNDMIKQISSVYSEENVEIEKQASQLLIQVENVLEENPEKFANIRKWCVLTRERLEVYNKMMNSILDKIARVEISENVDMSKTIGFTAEELRYLLRNARNKHGNLLVPEEQLADELATVITETVKKYPVNEIFVLSIMSLETGHFTSNYLKNYNNFGGVFDKEGVIREYATINEGIVDTIKSIYYNTKGASTIYEINSTYCPPSDKGSEDNLEEETVVTQSKSESEDLNADSENEMTDVEEENPYIWSKLVLEIMWMYVSSFEIIE